MQSKKCIELFLNLRSDTLSLILHFHTYEVDNSIDYN